MTDSQSKRGGILMSLVLMQAKYQRKSAQPHQSQAEDWAAVSPRGGQSSRVLPEGVDAPKEGGMCAGQLPSTALMPCAGRGEAGGKAEARAIKEERICSLALNFCTEQLGCVCRGAVASPCPTGTSLQCFSRSLCRAVSSLFCVCVFCFCVWTEPAEAVAAFPPPRRQRRPPTSTAPPRDLALARAASLLAYVFLRHDPFWSACSWSWAAHLFVC